MNDIRLMDEPEEAREGTGVGRRRPPLPRDRMQPEVGPPFEPLPENRCPGAGHVQLVARRVE